MQYITNILYITNTLRVPKYNTVPIHCVYPDASTQMQYSTNTYDYNSLQVVFRFVKSGAFHEKCALFVCFSYAFHLLFMCFSLFRCFSCAFHFSGVLFTFQVLFMCFSLFRYFSCAVNFSGAFLVFFTFQICFSCAFHFQVLFMCFSNFRHFSSAFHEKCHFSCIKDHLQGTVTTMIFSLVPARTCNFLSFRDTIRPNIYM